MEAKTPKGAKAWLDTANAFPLPILKASALLLTKQIKDGASLAEMAHTVERDPALCLHLFSAANRATPNSDTEILTLNHVITLLGMQGVVNVVKKAPQQVLEASDAYQKAYLQAQSNSLFAGLLAERWAEHVHVGAPEKLKWATILAGAPVWLMWRMGYGPMRLLNWQVHHRHLGKAESEKAILGLMLDDLLRLLGRHLGLPSLSQSLLECAERPTLHQWAKLLSPRHHDFMDDDVELRRQMVRPTPLMAVCSYLAEQSAVGWMTKRARRGQLLLSRMSGLAEDQVMVINHGLAVELSRTLKAEQILAPAKSLLWPTQERHDVPWMRAPMACWLKDPNPDAAPQPKAKSVAPAEVIPPRQPNKDLLLELIDQFNRKVASFKDIHDILLTCNKAIYEGLGMRRVFICVLSKKGDMLRPLYCVGDDEHAQIRGLAMALDKNRFFAKLLHKPASFKVDRDSYGQVKGMLEPKVAEGLGNQNFMVMSLFANGKPIGVVYADASEAEDRISDKEYGAFKKICQSASHALDSYAQQRRTG